MKMHYSLNEYCDMYLILGECHGNATEAARLYSERYSSRRKFPDANVFRRLDARMREKGSILPSSFGASGATFTTRTSQVEEEILNAVDQNPEISIRQLSRTFRIGVGTIHEILRDYELHPYHYSRVHCLLQTDYAPRVEFSTWLLQQPQHILDNILWTDETKFTRKGVFNFRNEHLWSTENPHATHTTSYQTRWTVNVWAGILGNKIIGPYILPDILTSQHYLVFLQEVLPELLQNESSFVENQILLQHDGAPEHFGIEVRAHLNEKYPNRWIGRGGPTPWPARSPDLTPLDFFLWGYLKENIYRTPVENEIDLVARLGCYIEEISTEMLQNVQASVKRRAELCRTNGGIHFEHLL